MLIERFRKLAAWRAKLQTRERELFGKCVSAQMEGDWVKATIYANQCAEVRKIISLVAGSKEALSKLDIPVGSQSSSSLSVSSKIR